MSDGKVSKEEDSMNFRMSGMELQGLHNTALSVIYNQERYSKELWQAACNYLLNLLIHATDKLSNPIGGRDD